MVGVDVRDRGTFETHFTQPRVSRHAHRTQLGDGLTPLCERDDFPGRGSRERGTHILFEITNI